MFHATMTLCLSKILLVKDELQLTNAISKENQWRTDRVFLRIHLKSLDKIF